MRVPTPFDRAASPPSSRAGEPEAPLVALAEATHRWRRAERRCGVQSAAAWREAVHVARAGLLAAAAWHAAMVPPGASPSLMADVATDIAAIALVYPPMPGSSRLTQRAVRSLLRAARVPARTAQ